MVFDQGKYRFLETGNSIEVGAVKDQKTEDMYYVNPVKGRYPNKKGEICIDRITLKLRFGGKVRTKDSIDMR